MHEIACKRRMLGAVLPWACGVATVSAWEYGMMIDAGSGGSRLHFYRWSTRVADPMNPQYAAVSEPEELFQVGVKPGISSFAYNYSGVLPYMRDLLTQAEERLHYLRESWYLIPVYLKATAGARDLFQDQRDEIFVRIRDALATCKFRFDSHYWARTISGEEEGVYAWLTVNALKGTHHSSAAEDTWGALDMGGASTQITFIPKDISIIQNYFPLHISYIHSHMYTHSYLEFGYRDADQRMMRRLIYNGFGKGTKESPVMNPCYEEGKVFEQILTTPFAVGHASNWVQGTGDLAHCIKEATALLKLTDRCYVPSFSRDFARNSTKGACSIAGVYQPVADNRRFVATGQYAKQAKKLGLPLHVLVPLSEWMAALEENCNGKVWQEFCWMSTWIGLVMTEGLRFPLHTKQVMFSAKLDGSDTGWALGAMMYEVNAYPWHAGTTSSNTPSLFAASVPAIGAGSLATHILVGALGVVTGWVAAFRWARNRSGFREPLLQA